jgi:hypothetical protein
MSITKLLCELWEGKGKGGVSEESRKGGILLQWQARLHLMVFLEYVHAEADSRNSREFPGIQNIRRP